MKVNFLRTMNVTVAELAGRSQISSTVLFRA